MLISLGLFLGSVVVYAETTELTLWHMEARPHRVERFKSVIEQFNEEHPNIEIKPQVQSWGEIYTKAPSAINAGRGPDILFATPDFTMLIKKLGVVQPLDDLVSELRKEYDFYESALKPYKFDGHTWAVPLYGMGFQLWYRRDLFKKAGLDPNNPPQTWNQLLKVCEKLEKSEVVESPIAVPGTQSMATDQLLYSLMITNKAEHLFAKDNSEEVIFNNPRTVETYKFYKKLFDYSPRGSQNWGWDQPRTALFSGRVAMVMEKGHYMKGWLDNTNLPLSILENAPVPTPEEGGQKGAIYYSNGAMLLSDKPEKKEASSTFFKWLNKPEHLGRFLNAAPGFFLPPNQEVLRSRDYWNNELVKKDPGTVGKILLQVQSSKYGELFGFTRDQVNPRIASVSGQNLIAWTAQQITVNGLSAEAAVEKGAERIREAIES